MKTVVKIKNLRTQKRKRKIKDVCRCWRSSTCVSNAHHTW